MNLAVLAARNLAAEAPLPPEADFVALRNQAVTWLQQWCGAQWTNFNDHDPGMMILDELLYALTELPYRAGLPVPQLLHAADVPVAPEDNALFAPTDILPMQPLTADDYARLLYDRIPRLVYAKVEPQPAGLPSSIAGIRQARVAVDPVSDRVANAEAAAAAAALLERHRNLGERFDDVAAEEPLLLSLRVGVQLNAEADPALVVANLYFAMYHALLPGPRFVALEEARKTQPIDVALCGPLLGRGVLLDKDLPELPSWSEARERIAQALLAVAAVRGVTVIDFLNEAQAAREAKPRLFAPDSQVTVRVGRRPGAGATGGPDLTVIFGASPAGSGVEKPVDDAAHETGEAIQARAVALIAAGGEKQKVQFERLRGAASAGPLSAGEPRPAVRDYFSVQHQFPPCFALQSGGLPPGVDSRRRAQVRQLKGYLLVFEQLMANYFAQLAATARFFSSRPQDRTVFTQPLASVPDVFPLLGRPGSEDLPADPAASDALVRNFWEDPRNPYAEGLATVAEDQARFLERRGRVLDHLLARFNEAKPAAERGTYQTIASREALLRDYRQLGLNRAAALVEDAASSPKPGRARSPRPRSGLEQKIKLLLRRDPASPGVKSSPAPAAGAIAHGQDFYYLLEPIRFLPRPVTAGPWEALPFPVSEFAPSLFHVFVNWTDAPLNEPFIAYAEARVLENAPAHLWHRFIWLDPHESSYAKPWKFLMLFRRWEEKGCPTLDWPRPLDGDANQAGRGHAAESLLAWLIESAAPNNRSEAP